MKIKIIIIAILAIASLNSYAQSIEYTYDDAGNRTSRKVMPAAPESVQETTEKNKEVTDVNEELTEENKKETEVYEDLVAEKQLRIYPNPTRGKLAVEIVNYNLNESGSIQVFDMAGRMVHNTRVLSQNMEIDITSEPAGSYIMVIVIGNEKSEWKIIKQ